MSAAPRLAGSAPHVLVVDDDEELGELLSIRLESKGYRVTVENRAHSALARLGREHVDAILLDLRLHDADGLEVLTEVRNRSPDLPVIILTAHGSIETAVEAMRRGAYGFLTKPFLDHDVLQKLTHAVESFALKREVAGLRRVVGGRSEDRRLLGVGPAITKARETIARLGPTDATVLVLGESGTGKELAARALHALSNRAKGPFVAVNCAALAPDLLESTLFGHTRGAFTGAISDREGLFGAARRGTLFLDEIGEASMAVQAKLLRVLQERRYARVGSTVEEDADVRVVAATNRDLRQEVAEKRFREDLFYRLHVVPLHLPPLREHPEDIPVLAELFLERTAARYGFPVPALSQRALATLLAHTWPGNVRELENVLEAALLTSGGGPISDESLRDLQPLASEDPAASSGLPGTPGVLGQPIEEFASTLFASEDVPTLRDARDAFERAYLAVLLKRVSGSVTHAARVAGRNRSDFYDLLRRHGLSAASFKRT
ncbi:MAG: sigma-54 dependent transcriptional regulator [Polyangiaceae bacterium]|jgi:two-component system response regulator GlrR|nr:sigma-54 dependent transcriptional regulator [Polyangiaceae bacterium]